MTLVLTGFHLEDQVPTVNSDHADQNFAVQRLRKSVDELISKSEESDSSATLDDILDATLADNVIIEEDEEDEDEDETCLEDEDCTKMERGRLNRTPLRNGTGIESPRTPDSGDTVRHGSVAGEGFYMPVLGATDGQIADHSGAGPSRLSPPAKVNHKKSTSNVESSARGLGIHNANNLKAPTSVSTEHSRKSSVTSANMSIASPSRGEEKKPSRSLSRKINNFFSSKKGSPHSRTPSADMDTHTGWGVSNGTNAKTRQTPQAIPRTNKNLTDRRGKSDSLIFSSIHPDGNGSVSLQPATVTQKAPVTPISTTSHHRATTSTTHNKDSRLQSVGIAFNVTHPLDDVASNSTTIKGQKQNTELGHRSSNSLGGVGMSTNNSHFAASIYRTPPLNTLTSFEKSTPAGSSSGNKANIRGGLHSNKIKDESRISTIFDLSAADDGLDSPGVDLYSNELLLRKLKIEIRELNATKVQLREEIESLTITRDTLTHEVENIKQEKEKSSVSSYEIFDTQPGDIHSDTSRKSSSSANRVVSDSKIEPRPKFWKIFGTSSRSGNSLEGSSVNTSLDTVSQNQMTLVDVCNMEGSLVPLVIRICLAQLESNNGNLKLEGLYRKSASNVLVENIEREMNEVDKYFVENTTQDVLETIKDSKLLELMERDVHAVASVLKRYLRHFPEPPLVYSIYDPMINLVKKDDLIKNLPLVNGKVPEDYVDAEDKEEKCKLFRTTLGTVIRLLNDLPSAHYETLKVICKHLILVSGYSERNLMSIHNLAIVFSPSLIHDANGDKDLADMKERYYLIEFILGQAKEIFD